MTSVAHEPRSKAYLCYKCAQYPSRIRCTSVQRNGKSFGSSMPQCTQYTRPLRKHKTVDHLALVCSGKRGGKNSRPRQRNWNHRHVATGTHRCTVTPQLEKLVCSMYSTVKLLPGTITQRTPAGTKQQSRRNDTSCLAPSSPYMCLVIPWRWTKR